MKLETARLILKPPAEEDAEARHLAINPASGRVMEKAGMGHSTPVDLQDRDDGRAVPGFVRHLHAGEWHALQP